MKRNEIKSNIDEKNRLNNKDLWKIYRRQFLIRAGLNFERQQSVGFTAAMIPLINKYYKTNEEKKEVMERHLNLFLTNPMMASIPIGVSLAMEESLIVNKDMSPDSVTSVKTALMGPLAALGDSLINGTLRPLVAGIAVSFAQKGNIIGPIIFFIVMAFTTLFIRYLGIFKGYKEGVKIVSDIQKSGLIDKITDIASVAAFVIVGGFIPSVVSAKLGIEFVAGESKLNIQEQLDSLVPSLLPLLITALMYYLIAKKKMSPTLLMFALMGLGIVGTLVGLF